MTTLTARAPGLAQATARPVPDTPPAPARRPLHFQIGTVGVALRSECDRTLVEFDKLYAPYRVDGRPPQTVDVEVRRKRLAPCFRIHYVIDAAGRQRFQTRDPAAVLPYLEWAINWQIVKLRPEWLQVHASVMQFDGGGIIFPGTPGSGKSTLAAGLLVRGWRYLSDEFALIDPATRALQPYPKALCLKEGSFAVAQRLGLPIRRAAVYTKRLKGKVRFLSPWDLRRDAIGTPCPVRAIVFPKYAEGATPKLTPISRAEAAFELRQLTFNFLDFGPGALGLLTDVVRQAECYRMVSGEIHASCDLIDLLASRELQFARMFEADEALAAHGKPRELKLAAQGGCESSEWENRSV